MTYKEIAEKCGVSISAVSKALNGKPGVNEALRGKICSLAEQAKETETKPQPTEAPVRKKRGRKTGKKYIGVLIRSTYSYFPYEMINRINEALRDTDYAMGVFRIEHDEDEIAKALSFEKEDRLAGLIFLGGRYDYTLEEIRKISVPFVMFAYTNRFGTLPADSYSSVSCDDYMTGYNAAEVLIKAGHRRIGAIFPGTDGSRISSLRYSGFCAALSDNGIELDEKLIAVSKCFDMDAAYQSARKLLESGEKMTAIYTVSDNMAMGVMKALADCGLKVPRDMSLISIDGLDFTRFTVPTLTTMVQPVREMGQECVHQLISLINGGEHRRKVFAAQLRPGGTVRKYKEK